MHENPITYQKALNASAVADSLSCDKALAICKIFESTMPRSARTVNHTRSRSLTAVRVFKKKTVFGEISVSPDFSTLLKGAA